MSGFSFAQASADPQEVMGEIEARRQYVSDVRYATDLKEHLGLTKEGRYGMVTWPADRDKVVDTALALHRLIHNKGFDCFETIGITTHELEGIASEVAETAVKIRELNSLS